MAPPAGPLIDMAEQATNGSGALGLDGAEGKSWNGGSSDLSRREPLSEKSASPPQRKRLKIAYLSGPCDAPAVFAEWSEGRNPGYFGSNYMKQFLEICAELDAESYVITNLPGKYSICRMGWFTFENRPPASGLKGIRYHLSFVPWFARLTPKLLQFKPDVIIATMYAPYWFLWFFLRWFGISVIPSFHGALWPKYKAQKLSSRILWQLNRLLFLRYVRTIVVTSNDITRQLRELLGEKDASCIDFVRHFPTYSVSQFASLSPPISAPRPPFRVFFAGRIEPDKGVYELLEVARRLEVDRKGDFHFDICGDGEELDALRRRIRESNLEKVVSCHGYCNPQQIGPLLGAAHAWIVPTTSDCAAGFEMVCAEAILANRPLIASDVCPALEDVREAVVEVEPDNVDQYCRAIIKLCDDRQYYLDKYKACAALHAPFYDLSNSWGEKMKEVLARRAICLPTPAEINRT
jgi:glycogen synthase